MGVHNLGYRGWSGELAPAWSRFVVITTTGVRRAWSSKWLRRMLFWAWAPTLAFAAGVFILEQVLSRMPETAGGMGLAQQQAILDQMENTPFSSLTEGIDLSTHASIRHTFWAKLMQMLFRYPQGALMVMLLGIIAPPLISQDVRSRAFLMYFSRPITRGEYIFGKACTIWVFLTAISAVPAFCLYILGILLSPSASVVLATWDLPFRILLASGFLMIPTASLALCLSSMTQESRVAGFAWFAIWILGFIAFAIISGLDQVNQFDRQYAQAQGYQLNQDGSMMTTPPAIPPPPISKWTYLSLYDTLGVAQSWAFGFEDFDRALPAIIVLGLITFVSMAVLYRRVSAPMQA